MSGGAGGRPTKYQDDYPDQVRRLCLLGCTDEEIAEFFGVVVATIYNWYNEHPEFLEARDRGKTKADGRVAEKLYHRALGYSHKAVKIFMPSDGVPVYADYIEHFPPDTQAARWWLSNRQPKKWKDRQAPSGDDEGGANDIVISGGLPDDH